MASINLSGILTRPDGEPDVGAVVRFTHYTTTGNTVKYSYSELVIPPDGAYNIDLEYGQVRIDYDSDYKTERFISFVVVNQDSTATSIPELLNASVPPTDEQLLEFQSILADTVAAKDIAVAVSEQITTTELINSSNSFTTGDIIETSGFTAKGDGGGAKWQLTAVTGTPSQTPAQLGDALLNDADGRRWELIESALFVEQIGGKLDEVTDNVLIQRAMIACGNRTGKNIYIGIGTFLTSDSLRYIDVSGVKIIGLDRYRSIIKLGSGVNDSLITTLRDNGCSISNITLDGNGYNQSSGHCIRFEDTTNYSLDRVEILNGNSYGIGAQGGTIKGLSVTNFNISGCGLDGVDVKNYNNDNSEIVFSKGTISYFGSTLAQQAGLDHRGYVKVSDVTVYIDNDTCRGFRTRNDGNAGNGGEGEYSNIRVINRVGVSAPIAIGFSHTSPRGNLTVNGLVCVDCSNGLRVEADGDDGNFSALTFTNSLGLTSSDQILLLGSRNIINGVKITGGSRYVDIASGANENMISTFRFSGTTTSSGIRIASGAEKTQLAIGLVSLQGIIDNGTDTVKTGVTTANI